MNKIFFIAAFVVGGVAVRAQQAKPVQFSLVPDISLHPRTTLIRGLALNFYGENPQHGVDLGMINDSTGESKGFTWALLVNHSDAYTGVAWSLINVSEDKFVGWQNGVANDAQGTFIGLQSGWFNVAQDFHGLQLGAVNYAASLRGVQIGLLNIAANNPMFREMPDKLATGFPILNWSF